MKTIAPPPKDKSTPAYQKWLESISAARFPQRLFCFSNDVNTIAGWNVIYKAQLYARLLSRLNDAIEFFALGSFANNSNEKRIHVAFGNHLLLVINSTQNGGNWTIGGQIVRTSSTKQRVIMKYTTNTENSIGYADTEVNLDQTTSFQVTASLVAGNDVVGRFFRGDFIGGSL